MLCGFRVLRGITVRLFSRYPYSKPVAVGHDSNRPSQACSGYMVVFNFVIVFPPVVAAALLRVIVGRLLGGQAMSELLIGAGSLVLAGAAHASRASEARDGATGGAGRAVGAPA